MIIIISRFEAFYKRLNASMCFPLPCPYFRPVRLLFAVLSFYIPAFPCFRFSIEKGCFYTPSNRKKMVTFFVFGFSCFLKINISILTRLKAFYKRLNVSTCFLLPFFRFRPAWLSIAVLSLCD